MEGWKVIWSREATKQRLEVEALHPRFGNWIRETLKSLDLESGPLFQDVPEGFAVCIFRDEWGEEMKIVAKVDFAARFFVITNLELKSRTWRFWSRPKELQDSATA